MRNKLGYRAVLLAAGFVAASICTVTTASAGLDMAVGARKVVQGQPISACNSAAKSALQGAQLSAQELGTDSGEWEGYGAGTTLDGTTTAAAIHCFPTDGGFVVTFTCAAQVPPSTDSAAALCDKLAAAFGAK